MSHSEPLAPPAPPLPVPPRRRGTGQVTIRDVARMAGVAPMTVSRALNKPDQVSAQVRLRIRDAIKASGYVPNLTAGALSSGQSRLIAAVVPTISTLTLHPMLQALGDALEANGYQLLLGQTGYDNARRDALLETILGRRPGGIVLTGVLEDAAWSERLRASGVPIVETWDLTPTPLDMLVGFSHAAMARDVVRYFHGRGYRRLALFGGDDTRSRLRSEAFCGEAARLGLHPPVTHAVKAPASLMDGRTGLASVLAGTPEVDAVFCSSDLVALGVLAEARLRGLAVPARMAVMGCGDLPFGSDLEPSLSTVHVDGEAIGRTAAGMLMALIEGRAEAVKSVDVGFSIAQRGTS